MAKKKHKADSLTMVRLSHDLRARKSYVTLVWDAPPDRHISLEVPFGVTLDELPDATEAAVAKFSTAFASAKIKAAEKAKATDPT